jgi:ribosomal protein S13
MPSYYDSTKAKPGLAEIKYQRGGEVAPLLGEPSQKELAEATRKAKRVSGAAMTPAKKKRLNAALAAELEKMAAMSKVPPSGLSGFGVGEALQRQPMGSANKMKKGGAVKKMRHGGKLKVRGMGAATRGGNFSRNG